MKACQLHANIGKRSLHRERCITRLRERVQDDVFNYTVEKELDGFFAERFFGYP
jgi:hypothetical protein